MNFDLSISKGVDTLVPIVHFLNHKWEPSHVTISLFKTLNTFWTTIALQVNKVLTTYGLNVKIIAYVKDEHNYFSIMITTLTFVVLFEVLGLTTPFITNCWGHTIFKCCQYVIDDTIICVVKLTSISIKKCQSILWKTIITTFLGLICFSILWCCQTGNHPQRDLAMFGYRLTMKV